MKLEHSVQNSIQDVEREAAVRREVLKEFSTYVELVENLVGGLFRTLLTIVVLTGSIYSFALILRVHFNQEAANIRLTDLTLGDLFGGTMPTSILYIILIGLAIYLWSSRGKALGFRNVIRDRVAVKLHETDTPNTGIET